MRQLTLIKTLEFYDVPQILVATDAMGTLYLCTLFDYKEETGFHYLGVQMSEHRLMAFIGGQLDLRDTYTHPEAENAVFAVSMYHEVLTTTNCLQSNEITERMLPEAGYYFDSKEIIEDSEQSTDVYQLEVPTNDRFTFSTIISRMGWRASALRKTFGKIAFLL